jgi:hypothetical protein
MAELKQPDRQLETADCELAPPSRRPWITPRVIASTIDQTEAAPGVNVDGVAGSVANAS